MPGGDLIRVGLVLKIPPAARAEVVATPESTTHIREQSQATEIGFRDGGGVK
jgi:hypothetical protein